MKKIVVLKPDKNDNNPYINTIRRCLESNDMKVISPKMVLLPQYLRERIYVSNFNWYENVERRNIISTCITIINRKMMLLYLKYIRKSKIIITIHNKKNHKSSTFNYSEKMLVWLIRKADTLVILCDETRPFINSLISEGRLNKDVVKIGIPNYVGVYKKSSGEEFRKVTGYRDDCYFEIAYFGNIKEYKNIEIIDELAAKEQGKKIHFSIVGKGDEEYVSYLNDRFAGRHNITFKNEYIPDDRIWGFIKGADCILLPFRKETVLNSASVVLALSAGTNVICPINGTTKEFPDGLIYSYDYFSDGDHLDELCKKVEEAYYDYTNRRNYFNERIKTLNKIVNTEFSYEKTKEQYKKLYNGLIN